MSILRTSRPSFWRLRAISSFPVCRRQKWSCNAPVQSGSVSLRPFEAWSVKPLEMIVAAPHADEIIQAGSGLAANVYREETERFARTLARVLQEAARQGELNLKKAGLTASSAADLLVVTARGAKEDGKDPALYRKRLARLIRVFDCVTSYPK